MILPDIVRASEARRAVTPRRVSGRSGRSDAPRTESARVVNRRRVSALADSPVASPAARSARELRFARSSRSRRLPDARVLGAHSRARARFRAVSRSSRSPRRRSGSHARRPSNDAGRGGRHAAIRGCPGIRRERPARIHADPRARDGPGPTPKRKRGRPPARRTSIPPRNAARPPPPPPPPPPPRPRVPRGCLSSRWADARRCPPSSPRLRATTPPRVSSTRGQGEPPFSPENDPSKHLPGAKLAYMDCIEDDKYRVVDHCPPGGWRHREAPREGRRRPRRRRRKRPVHLHHRQGGRRVVARRLVRREGATEGRGAGEGGGVRRRRSSEGGRGEDEGATKRED